MPEAFPVLGVGATPGLEPVDDARRTSGKWVTLSGMALQPYEFRDPEALLGALAERVPFTEDTAYLVLVAHPSTTQRIVRVERLDSPAVLDEWSAARDEMRDRIQAWPIPDVVPPTHAGVLVVVRRGLCVFGANEGHWSNAWRYVNHLRRLYSGDLVLVTEHGWLDLMTQLAGHSPALEESPTHDVPRTTSLAHRTDPHQQNRRGVEDAF